MAAFNYGMAPAAIGGGMPGPGSYDPKQVQQFQRQQGGGYTNTTPGLQEHLQGLPNKAGYSPGQPPAASVSVQPQGAGFPQPGSDQAREAFLRHQERQAQTHSAAGAPIMGQYGVVGFAPMAHGEAQQQLQAHEGHVAQLGQVGAETQHAQSLAAHHNATAEMMRDPFTRDAQAAAGMGVPMGQVRQERAAYAGGLPSQAPPGMMSPSSYQFMAQSPEHKPFLDQMATEGDPLAKYDKARAMARGGTAPGFGDPTSVTSQLFGQHLKEKYPTGIDDQLYQNPATQSFGQKFLEDAQLGLGNLFNFTPPEQRRSQGQQSSWGLRQLLNMLQGGASTGEPMPEQNSNSLFSYSPG